MTQEICADFVGRERKLKKIAEFAKADEPKGLSLLGLPQIGRSRLLCEIEGRRDESEANVCVVRIECKRRTEVIRWSDLLRTIAQRVCTRFQKRAAVSHLASEYENAVWTDSPTAEGAEAKTWHGFFEDLQTTAPEFRVVFLLDDFDQCKPHERPQPESQAEWVTGWHFTRFVAYPNVGLIITSTRHIQQVRSFLTYFTEQWLSPFTKEEMDTLVQANAFRPSARLENDVCQWAGGFPGLACKLLGHNTSPELVKSERTVWLRDDVKPWFDEVWDLLHPFERQLLVDLAKKPRSLARRRRLQLRYEKEKDVAELLEEKGLVTLDGEWAQLVLEALRVRILLLPEVAEKKWWHFTGERLFWLSIGSMIISSVLVSTLGFVGENPSLGALPMLLPFIYGIYGLSAQRYENA
jgi:hypothetical protein